MDHAVSVDIQSNELGKLLSGKATAIIRGARGLRKPNDKVFPGEYVYFVRDFGDKVAVARGLVKDCICLSRSSGALTAADLVKTHKEKLDFNDQEIKKWSKRKHILLVELDKVSQIGPFAVRVFEDGNDWESVDYINQIRKD